MRRMSFAHTTRQMYDRTKTVTRRLGWKFLKPGDVILAVEKCQGLKKGQKQTIIGKIVITEFWRESLFSITQEDVAREGFPYLTAAAFVRFFCQESRCTPDTIVTRIEFEHVHSGPLARPFRTH